jgi:hypothetical protein
VEWEGLRVHECAHGVVLRIDCNEQWRTGDVGPGVLLNRLGRGRCYVELKGRVRMIGCKCDEKC